MMDVQLQEKIKAKVEEMLKIKGIDLVEFRLFQKGRMPVVRCLIDYPCGGITVDECAGINKNIWSYLEASGFLGEDYLVEVNSPGLDRKFTAYKDFLRVKGKVISLWLKQPFKDKEYLEGELVDLNEVELVIKGKEENFRIKLEQIKAGKEKIKC